MVEQTIVLNLDTQKFNRSLGLVKSALGGLAAGAVLKGIVDTTARFEDLEATLNSITGSAKGGAAAFANISKFATKTQFGVEELTNTYIKLAGAGISPTEKLLTTFTDTAAVTTDQLGTLTAMTDLFSRTVSGGLGLEELNRLADRGVPVFKILEEQLGITRLEVSEYGKTAEGARKITDALTVGLDAAYGGTTISKLLGLNTIQTNFGIQLRNTAYIIGKELAPALKAVISDFTIFLGQNDELAKSIGAGLGKTIQGAGDAVRFLAENFEIVRGVIYSILGAKLITSVDIAFRSLNRSVKAGGGLMAALSAGFTGAIAPLRALTIAMLANPFGAIIAAIALLILYLIGQNGLGRSLAQISAAFSYFGIQLGSLGKWITEKFNNALTELTNKLVYIYEFLSVLQPGLKGFQIKGTKVGDAISKSFDATIESVGNFKDAVAAAGKEWDRLQKGIGAGSGGGGADSGMAANKSKLGDEGDFGGGGSSIADAAAAAKEAAESKLLALESSLRTEVEAENFAYQERLTSLAEFSKLYVNEQTRLSGMKERIEAAHQANMRNIQAANFDKQLETFKSGKSSEVDYTAFSEKEKVKFAYEAGKSTLDALKTHSRAAFNILKAISISEAIINTANGVTKALAQGGVFGPIMAGIVIAMGAAQIATIASQQYTGRAVGGTISAGKPYLVGEQGPEMMVPAGSGTMVPNRSLNTGAGTVNVNFTITAVDAAGIDQLLIQRKAMITGFIREATENQGNRSFV